jgi:peptide methionine sulfoxide reductase msrA/msrB
MRAIVGTLIVLGMLACSSQAKQSVKEKTEAVTKAQKNEQLKEQKQNTMSNWKELNAEETRVIINKGTEYPYTGDYNSNKKEGTYHCKQCHTPLFLSTAKFDSGSGWPSFDDAIKGAVKELPDADGRRSEIVCANCQGHLGHVFTGEQMTVKNTRHCVNSISLDFKAEATNVSVNEDTAYFASGCFWGTEYYLQQLEGVSSTDVGYMGGMTKNPTYKEVCSGNTGHAEVVKVVFNSDSVSYDKLARLFFETHDPSQKNRQGPDIGTQYRSEVFYTSDSQKKTVESLISKLTEKGTSVATAVTKAPQFWKGEEYHQDYYLGNGGRPYCHSYKKKF